ncbi:MAG: hypothetical protein AAB691_02025 [Patescibacteria group bacterium]
METHFRKIKLLLESSSLSDLDRDELLVALLLVTDEQLGPIHELLKEDISWADKLFENYRSKKGAIRHDDKDFWEMIMKEEESEATKLESN